SAFGELLAHTGSDTQPYAFTGEPLDPNSGWQYHRARWMDPRVGRFEGIDPYRGDPFEPLTLHRYLYAAASPLDRTDASGREGNLVSLGVAMCIQGIVNAIATARPDSSFATVFTSFAIGAAEGALFYYAGGAALRTLLRGVRYMRYTRVITAVLSRVEDAGAAYRGTLIPRYFTFATRGGRVFVNPNATEHLAELVSRNPVAAETAAAETKMATSLILESLEEAVSTTLNAGVRYGELIEVGGWKLVFAEAREAGAGMVRTVLKHAIYTY
ncbi:MAG: RHS repeat-associated core domain-containing protein, partial [Coriobacteriia bacterium]|nr:RHS repeat-associated core domain-containing protein [Coriobacteriia bacterium]